MNDEEVKRKVLMMDDEEHYRMVFGALLKYLGVEVEFAETGKEALKKYTEARKIRKPFDVVILDINMPGTWSGFEVFNRLTCVDPEINAYLTSGYVDESEITEFMKNGVKGFIKKPFYLEDLRKVLNMPIEDD